jgi:hypothetical protein
MSRLTGDASDLISHIFMSGDEGDNFYECFLKFKEATRGVIHIVHPVKINKANAEYVAKHSRMYDYFKEIRKFKDGRCKCGYRSDEHLVFQQKFGNHDRFDTIEELVKSHGSDTFYVTEEYKFEDILDIMPYLAHGVGSYMMSTDDNGNRVVSVTVSGTSMYDDSDEMARSVGMDPHTSWRRREYLEFFRDVVINYLNPIGRIIVKDIYFDKGTTTINVGAPIDSNFPVEIVLRKDVDPDFMMHQPELVNADEGTVDISGVFLTDYQESMTSIRLRFVAQKAFFKKEDLKLIDLDRTESGFRAFFGKKDCDDYWGDDWNDKPYEHNAGEVYDRYVERTVDFNIPFGCKAYMPCDGEYNSPWSKEDFKNMATPILIVVPKSIADKEMYSWSNDDYKSWVGTKGVVRFYLEDSKEEVVEKLIGLYEDAGQLPNSFLLESEDKPNG